MRLKNRDRVMEILEKIDRYEDIITSLKDEEYPVAATISSRNISLSHKVGDQDVEGFGEISKNFIDIVIINFQNKIGLLLSELDQL